MSDDHAAGKSTIDAAVPPEANAAPADESVAAKNAQATPAEGVAKPNPSTDGIRAEELLSAALDVRSTDRQQVARTQAALVEKLRNEPNVRAATAK